MLIFQEGFHALTNHLIHYRAQPGIYENRPNTPYPHVGIWTVLTAMSDLLPAMSDLLAAMSDLLTAKFSFSELALFEFLPFRFCFFSLSRILLLQITPFQNCPVSEMSFDRCFLLRTIHFQMFLFQNCHFAEFTFQNCPPSPFQNH